jgi:hypothetical protein
LKSCNEKVDFSLLNILFSKSIADIENVDNFNALFVACSMTFFKNSNPRALTAF